MSTSVIQVKCISNSTHDVNLHLVDVKRLLI